MAEAAGLVLGALALVELFGTCIELFDYIVIGRSFDRDSKILRTKLDVERVLLLHWAERTGLLKDRPDARFGNDTTIKLVVAVLESVKELLGDGENLCSRYGLQSAETTENNEVGQILSDSRMQTAIKDLKRLKPTKSQYKEPSNNVNPLKKALWAIHDKAKFGKLIEDLSYFVAKLTAILPPSSCPSNEQLMQEDLNAVRSMDCLQLLSEAAKGNEPELADCAKERLKLLETAAQTQILDTLWFRTMDDRRDDVTNAHPETYEWALSSTIDRDWDSLPDFLRSDTGIYCVLGKPGSGKSTLMKHVYYHPKTNQFLKQWAGSCPFTNASFFFCYAGTTHQRSHSGLVRALLFNLLSPLPELIPQLLPRTWKEAYTSIDSMALPSDAEIKQALFLLSRKRDIGHKWCFFIDGLDEYEGNPAAAISTLTQLASNSDIKIIVSCRPLAVFVNAFSERLSLQLQDLTRHDLARYIDDVLNPHPHLKLLRQARPERAGEIRADLLAKASGVFLWVILACRTVQEGLNNSDSLTELLSRIDELPEELVELFQHILGQIEPRYHCQAAKFLRLQYCRDLKPSSQPLNASAVAILIDDDLDVHTIRSVRTLSRDDIEAKLTMLQGRLRSRCRGLLELKRHDSRRDRPPDATDTARSSSRHLRIPYREHGVPPPWMPQPVVEFMHRTVFEFLSTPGVLALQCLSAEDENFDANEMLTVVTLYALQLRLLATTKPNNFTPLVRDALDYMNSSFLTHRDLVKLLTMLVELTAEFTLAFYLSHADDNPLSSFLANNAAELGYLLALELGMTNILEAYPYSCGDFLRPSSLTGFPLLYHALARPFFRTLTATPTDGMEFSLQNSLNTINYLFSKGADPNTVFMASSETFFRDVDNTILPWLLYPHAPNLKEAVGFGQAILAPKGSRALKIDSPYETTTPWKWWLHNVLYNRAQLGLNLEQCAEIARSFVDAGAALLLSDLETSGYSTRAAHIIRQDTEVHPVLQIFQQKFCATLMDESVGVVPLKAPSGGGLLEKNVVSIVEGHMSTVFKKRAPSSSPPEDHPNQAGKYADACSVGSSELFANFDRIDSPHGRDKEIHSHGNVSCV